MTTEEISFDFHKQILSEYNRPRKGFPLIVPYELLSMNENVWKYHTSGKKAYVVRNVYGVPHVSKQAISNPSERHRLSWDYTKEMNQFMKGKWLTNNNGDAINDFYQTFFN